MTGRVLLALLVAAQTACVDEPPQLVDTATPAGDADAAGDAAAVPDVTSGPKPAPDDTSQPHDIEDDLPEPGLPMPLDALAARRIQGAVVWEPDHEYHTGEDLIVDWEAYWTSEPPEVPALAPDAGTIVLAGSHYGLGSAVGLMLAKSGQIVLLGHLDSVAPGIAVGTAVPRAAALGTVGTSGASGPCPHIHLEVLPAGTWDRPLSDLGLDTCGLTNPADVAPEDALAQDSCFHYFSEGNTLLTAIDAAFARPDEALRWPDAWLARSDVYPWVECTAACSAYCYDLIATPDGCEQTATDGCPACVPATEDPRCAACPGPGCW